jgi:hypothetical protein
MTVVAGVDSSTSATKVQFRNLVSGAVVGFGSAPHPPTRPPRSERDPTAWWAAFTAAHHVAAGACVQAAAVLTGDDPADIADRWGLGRGVVVEPMAGGAARHAVRAAYATVRDAQPGA